MLANIIIIAVVIVAVALCAKKYVTQNVRHGCCGGDEDVKLKRVADRDESHYPNAYVVKVEGMSCSNCANRVANAFNGHDGFLAKVDLGRGEATVRTTQPVSADELREIVRNAGYGVGEVQGI